jgi:acetyl esterase/lipase
VKDSLRPLDRRRFLGSVAAATALARSAHAEVRADREATYDYKVVGDCRIKADVYGATRDVVRPGVIWIHGGALIMGDRGRLDRALLDALIAAGYVVVSIDYRLAPETKLPAIIEDVRDACRWARERGPELFRVAPDRIAVMGASAGGYLTLVSGYSVEPRPKALVSYYGYGDVAGVWYSRPDPFYRRQPLVPEDEARAAVGGAVRSESSGDNNDRRRFSPTISGADDDPDHPCSRGLPSRPRSGRLLNRSFYRLPSRGPHLNVIERLRPLRRSGVRRSPVETGPVSLRAPRAY